MGSYVNAEPWAEREATITALRIMGPRKRCRAVCRGLTLAHMSTIIKVPKTTLHRYLSGRLMPIQTAANISNRVWDLIERTADYIEADAHALAMMKLPDSFLTLFCRDHKIAWKYIELYTNLKVDKVPHDRIKYINRIWRFVHARSKNDIRKLGNVGTTASPRNVD